MKKQINIAQQIGLFLVVGILLFQAFQRSFILADYYLETEKYAVHCINKSRPMMHCDGKCQLMQDLADTEQHSPKKPSSENHQLLEVVLFMEQITDFGFLIEEESRAAIFPNQFGRPSNLSFFIFRPPRSLA